MSDFYIHIKLNVFLLYQSTNLQPMGKYHMDRFGLNNEHINMYLREVEVGRSLFLNLINKKKKHIPLL